MSFFGVRYWTVLFWLNVVLSVVHACNGHNYVFLAMGMAVLCRVMIALLKRAEEVNNG